MPRRSQGSSRFDLELDDADDEEGVDSEPSLGSVNSWGGCQSLWAEGAPMFCLEDEHDCDLIERNVPTTDISFQPVGYGQRVIQSSANALLDQE